MNINQLATQLRQSLTANQRQQLIAQLQQPTTNAATSPLEAPDVVLGQPEQDQPAKRDQQPQGQRMATAQGQPLNAPDVVA
jgi:hypothetical protein